MLFCQEVSQSPEIFPLSIEWTMKLGAGAWMVEGNQLVTIPLHGCTNVACELDVVRSDEIERFERHLTQTDDEARRENVERLAQVRRAVVNLAYGWRRIASPFITGITEHGVGDEYLFAGQTGLMQEQREVASRLILREWNAATVAAQPSGCFGDEQHPGMHTAVGGTEHAPSPFHTLTEAACLHLFDQLRERFVCIHRHIVLYRGSVMFIVF